MCVCVIYIYNMSAIATEGKVITCKAAVQFERKGELQIVDVQVAPPKRLEVRIKIIGSGVCHTDYSEPLYASQQFPVILGHEGGGIVESIGEGVTSVKVGDHVIPLYIPECRNEYENEPNYGFCCYCTKKNFAKTNLCGVIRGPQGKGVMPDGTSRFSTMDGKVVHHFMGCSTFSQYTVCPEISVAVVPKEAPLDKIGLLGCGITTGYGAVMNTIKVEPDTIGAVWGLGGVGLAVIMGLKEAGCRKIVAIDINEAKFPMAKDFGATDFVNPKTVEGGDLGAYLNKLCGGYPGAGPDYTFEAIGNTTTMRQALEYCHKGWGKSCIIGVAPEGKEIATRSFQMVIGKEWHGTAFGGTRGRTQLGGYVQKYLDGKLKVDEFITFTFPLKDINEAFHKLHSGEALRSVILLQDGANM